MMHFWTRRLAGTPRVSAAAIILLTLVFALGLPSIGFDVHPNATFQSDNQASRDLARMHDLFGVDDNDVVVLITGDSLWRRQTIEELRQLQSQIESLPHVAFVTSFLDLNRRRSAFSLVPNPLPENFDPKRLRDDLLAHPIARSQMVSEDGELISMLVRIEGGSLSVLRNRSGA